MRIDPRAILLSVLVGLAYLALGSPWPLAIGAGVLVFTVKTLLEVRVWRRSARTPAPLPGTPEALWLQRAELAFRSIGQLRRSARTGTLAQRCAAIAAQAELRLASLRQITYQASVVSAVPRSRDNAEQRQAAERLEATQRDLQARIEASTLGLEGVVARLAEILAIADGSARTAPVSDLVDELDSLRDVLIETEQLGQTSVPAITATTRHEGR